MSTAKNDQHVRHCREVSCLVSFDRESFQLSLSTAPLRLTIRSAGGIQEFIPQIGLDTISGFDRIITTGSVVTYDCGEFQRVSWKEISSQWTKTYKLDVFQDYVQLGVTAEGKGRIDTVRYFSSISDATYREHFPLVKHFNDRYHTSARDYQTASPLSYTHLLCPEPNSYARQVLPSSERAQISVNSDIDNFGGNFVANPSILAFAASAAPETEWWAIGLATQPGQHHFSEYEYNGSDGLSLQLNYWGALAVEGVFSPPCMVLVPGKSAERALSKYIKVLGDKGLAKGASHRGTAWWEDPIICGWGHQAFQGDLFRIRSGVERPRDNATYMMSTQLNYLDIHRRAVQNDLPFGTLIIDARWFISGGLKNVDIGRWPDLRGFIDYMHNEGKRVLLWWSPWDPEGVPSSECVTWVGDIDQRVNRPGRLAKFGPPQPGAKLTVDVSLPTVVQRIKQQIHKMLGSGPGCANADGFKIDHQSMAPGLYGMGFVEQSERIFGIEGAFIIQQLIYETSKEVKADALIIGQSPNPYFAQVQDMVRLGDIYAPYRDSVVETMAFRATMARIADPEILIDTDGWPMPSLSAWREYALAQPRLGVPSLYYVSHLDTTGEEFTPEDFRLLRNSWAN